MNLVDTAPPDPERAVRTAQVRFEFSGTSFDRNARLRLSTPGRSEIAVVKLGDQRSAQPQPAGEPKDETKSDKIDAGVSASDLGIEVEDRGSGASGVVERPERHIR